jgi:PKD repeat protein
MKMRKILMVGFIIVFFLSAAGTPFGAGENNSMVYTKTKTVSEQTAENFGEEKILMVPAEPLEFATTVNWEISVDKKMAFSTAAKPFAKIFTVDVRGKSKEEVVINAGETKKGKLQIQPGQSCRIQLNAGQYKGLFNQKYGAVVKAACEYEYIKVTTTELDAVGKLSLFAEGPKNTRWIWGLPGNQQLSGKAIQYTFQPGLARVSLDDEEQYNHFDLQLAVPEAMEINPQLSATNGYEEFTIRGTSGLKSHYRSSSECWWDFGDGTPEVNRPDCEHTFRKPGTYTVTMGARNSLGPSIEKKWQVFVLPFNIINNDVSVYPAKGSTPLRVYYSAKPKVLGQPVQLKYFWDFGDGTTSQSLSGDHVYSKKGDYKITFQVKDDYHPNFYVAPWTGTVTVLPPVINVRIQGTPTSGVIPLQVRFVSELKIEGGPTDIEYHWDFGDDSTSNIPNPTHTFGEPGRYRVVLTVRDWINDTSYSSSVFVDVRPPMVISRSNLEPLFGPAPLQVQGTGLTDVDGYPVELNYAWYIDGKLAANTKNLKYVFQNPGSYKVTLLITDTMPGHTARAAHTWQVTVTNSGIIEYRPTPVPNLAPTPTPNRHRDDKRDEQWRWEPTPVPTPTPFHRWNDSHDNRLNSPIVTLAPTPAPKFSSTPTKKPAPSVKPTFVPSPLPTSTPVRHWDDRHDDFRKTPGQTPLPTSVSTPTPEKRREDGKNDRLNTPVKTPAPTSTPTPVSTPTPEKRREDGKNDRLNTPVKTPAPTSAPTLVLRPTPEKRREDGKNDRLNTPVKTPAKTPALTPAPIESPENQQKDNQKEKDKRNEKEKDKRKEKDKQNQDQPTSAPAKTDLPDVTPAPTP